MTSVRRVAVVMAVQRVACSSAEVWVKCRVWLPLGAVATQAWSRPLRCTRHLLLFTMLVVPMLLDCRAQLVVLCCIWSRPV